MFRRRQAQNVARAAILVFVSGCELAVNLAHFDDGCRPGRGPSSVRIQTPEGSFCIDSTEVTNADYAAFLTAIGSSGPTSALPASCSAQTDFTPSQNWPAPPGTEPFPVDNVNWCEATAYCAWAGKRLCGRIGGGPIAVGTAEHDATQSEWFDACSAGGAHAYPYGDTFDATICGGNRGPVGAHTGCVGGYPGIYDMNGELWEWNNACDSDKPDSFCHTYGGAFDSKDDELACNGAPRPWTRSSTAANIGIRCCQDI
jgi:sulfatase modifying factor 1